MKVGDRVRILRDLYHYQGKTGIIIKGSKSGWLVKLDAPITVGKNQIISILFSEDELEAISDLNPNPEWGKIWEGNTK